TPRSATSTRSSRSCAPRTSRACRCPTATAPPSPPPSPAGTSPDAVRGTSPPQEGGQPRVGVDLGFRTFDGVETEPYPKQALYLAAPALAALVGVHLLPDAGGVDPIRELMSEYPVRSDVGTLYTLALLVANVAVMILGVHWV